MPHSGVCSESTMESTSVTLEPPFAPGAIGRGKLRAIVLEGCSRLNGNRRIASARNDRNGRFFRRRERPYMRKGSCMGLSIAPEPRGRVATSFAARHMDMPLRVTIAP